MTRTVLTLLLLTGCVQIDIENVQDSNMVWSVDLIRTLPGQQANYIRSIETNWSNARSIARKRGAVLSYKALVAPQDSARGWDVMLMTEYADSTEWVNREAIFEAIFESDEYVRIEPASPSSEMRQFFGDETPMHIFVNQ